MIQSKHIFEYIKIDNHTIHIDNISINNRHYTSSSLYSTSELRQIKKVEETCTIIYLICQHTGFLYLNYQGLYLKSK